MSGYPNSISSRDASGPKVEPDPTSLWTAESRAKRAKARLDSLRAQEDEDIRNIDRRRDDRIARVKARFTSEEERISNSKSYAEAKADAAWERARQSRDRASEFDRRSSYDISRIRDGRRAWESYYAEIRRIQDTLGTERERCRQDRSKNRDDETTAMNRIYAESREETLKVREALQAADKESVEADKKLALAKLEFSRAEKHRSESEIEEKAAQDEKAAAESANASDEAQTTSEAASLPAKAQAQTTFEAASLSAKAQAQTTSEAAALPAEAKALIDEAAAVLKEVKAKRAEADKVLQETRTETDAALQEAQVKADKADALLRETEAETSAARREAQVKADKADVLLQKTEAETSAALQEAQAKAREFLEEAEKTATKAVADTKAEAAALLEEVSNQAKETAAALEEATAKAAEADALLQGAAIESRGTETALGKANEMVTGAEARLDVAEARFNKMAAALEAETEAALEAKRAGSGGWTGIKKVFGRSLRGSGGKNTQQANIKSPPGSFLQSRTLHGTSNVDKQEEDSQGSSLESGDPRTAFAGASTLVAKIGRHDPMAMLVCSLLLAIILAAFWMFRRKWFCGLRSACTAASNDAGAAGAERGQRSRKQHSSHRCSEYHAVDDIEGGAHEAATTDFGANISGDAGHSSPASASTMFSTNIADYAKNGRKTRIMPDDPPGVNEYHYDYTNRNKMVAPYIVKEKSNKEMSVSFSGKDVVKNIALVCDPHDSYPMHQNPAERDSAFDRCIVNEQGTCSGIMNVPHGKDIMVGAGSTAVGNNDDRNSLANQTGKPKQQRKNMGKHLSTISLTRAHGDEVNSGFATDATGTHQKIDAVDGGDCGNAFSCL